MKTYVTRFIIITHNAINMETVDVLVKTKGDFRIPVLLCLTGTFLP